MKTRTPITFKRLPTDYSGLCRRLLPRPIHDDIDYSNVTEMTDAMVLWQDEFTDDQRDYFELLCTLLEAYDAANDSRSKISGLEILRHLMEENDMSAADLSRLLGGSRNLGAMILRGERNLTVAHIRTLADRFGVGPELFLSA